MSRRTQQLFSLSLLDLLTSALGAVIFLFIITPKGGASASTDRQAMVYFDTTLMKIHGELPDSLLNKMAGDTMQVVLMAYQEDPQAEELVRAEAKKRAAERAKAQAEAKAAAEARAKERALAEAKANKRPAPTRIKEKPTPAPAPPKPEVKPTPTPPAPEPKPVTSKPSYTGSGPSVPANVSFEVNWKNKDDNVDLYVCKGGDCVYGGRKKDRDVGDWDSGKSRNRIFGNDLRTNQEAVRQFDKIIPGEYKIYVRFKDSKTNQSSVDINGLIYTKDPKTSKERGEAFSTKIKRGSDRVHIATVSIKADGSYTMRKP
jgi:hypothetical protein